MNNLIITYVGAVLLATGLAIWIGYSIARFKGKATGLGDTAELVVAGMIGLGLGILITSWLGG